MLRVMFELLRVKGLRVKDESKQEWQSAPERKGRKYRHAAWLGILAACLIPPVTVWAQDGPPDVSIGKQIYTKGESPSGPTVEAVLGGGSTTIPASLMPCSSCHGDDGLGRPEGGVTPSNLTWEVLGAPLNSTDRLARSRPAYDEKSLKKAISEGFDPAGNELGTAMPRFKMSAREMNSLIMYLKRLGNVYDPGITKNKIRLGTVIPSDGPLAATGKNFAELLKAYFAELNKGGGVYGRNIDLEVLHAGGTPANIAKQTEQFVAKNNIFGLIGMMAPGAEREVEAATEKAGVPVITPFAIRDEESGDTSKVFYVLSGVPQEARVLVRFARIRIKAPEAPISVVYSAENKELASSVVRECRNKSFASVISIRYGSSPSEAARIADSLSRDKVNAVLFLGSGKELKDMLVAARKLNWHPDIFQPGSFAGEDVFSIPAEFNERVFFSFPSLPTDLDVTAVRGFGKLLQDHNLTPKQPALAISVLATAEVLTEGLRASGRNLSRVRLVETLSTMYSFDTGFTPPITFGATKRIGALGSYVVKLDLKKKTLAPVESWMTP